MLKIDTSPQKINDFLERGVSEVITRESVAKKLASGQALRVKHGVDPSGDELHLGHAAVYFKLRDLQELGHKIVFLIGGFTGRFGDPTEKLKARTLKTKEETEANAENYLNQIKKILDVDLLEVRYNSEWYDSMSAEGLLKLISNFTVDQALEREMFKTRKNKREPIQLHEVVYPVLQGYDSVELRSDLTVVGTDQIFNENFGRELQKKSGQEPQDIVAIEILVGLDGKQKMSKSLDNYIALNDPPGEMFGKIMSLPDKLITSYFTLLTRLPLDEIREMSSAMDEGSINPKDLKIKLGREIVSFFHSPKDAGTAAENFDRVFSKKEIPKNTKEVAAEKKVYAYDELPDLLIKSGVVKSKTEARRLLDDGAVESDGKPIAPNDTIDLTESKTIRIGKHRWIKFVPKN